MIRRIVLSLAARAVTRLRRRSNFVDAVEPELKAATDRVRCRNPKGARKCNGRTTPAVSPARPVGFA